MPRPYQVCFAAFGFEMRYVRQCHFERVTVPQGPLPPCERLLARLGHPCRKEKWQKQRIVLFGVGKMNL
jgi:hypothetical protein